MKVELSHEEMRRYACQISLPEVGAAGQLKLHNSRVLIVGAGGLGLPCAMYLAAAGVGNIGLIDADAVGPSNLHRQVLYTPADIGLPKAEVLARRLNLQNPAIGVTAFCTRFLPANALDMIRDCDVVIDCTDNLESRYLINDACVQSGKPFVSAGVHRYEGQIGVYNLHGSSTYRCCFPENKTPDMTSCEENGVFGVVPGALGVFQATEALKIVLLIDGILKNKILFINLLTYATYIITGSRNEDSVNRALQRELTNELPGSNDTLTTEEIAVKRSSGSLILVDVRSHEELPVIRDKDIIQIPFQDLASRLKELPPDAEIAFFCASGKRSREAVRKSRLAGYDRTYAYSGPVNALIEAGII